MNEYVDPKHGDPDQLRRLIDGEPRELNRTRENARRLRQITNGQLRITQVAANEKTA